MTTAIPARHPAVDALAAAIGAEHVLTDAHELRFYSTDIYREGLLPCAVVRPGSPDDVSAVLRIARDHGLPVVPRGGGASYTDGYLPTQPDSILVDTLRLKQIVEVNEQDMYVIVEAGVTWAELEAELRTRGVRPVFAGPFSGIAATIGGSLSQNTVSWGTGVFGTSAEAVLGLEVALADGSLLRTGTWGVAGSTPFFCQHGPDLTGLFMGDAGAYGIKTRVSLRLLRRPPAFACLSFKFGTFEAMARGMAAAAREGNHTLNFGLDPALQQGQLGKTDAGAAMQAALAVFRSSRSILDGLVQMFRMAAAGRRFLQGEQYSVHYIVEGSDARAVRSAAGRLRDVLAPFGAETANTLPAVVYALPFAPLYNILGPRGERWVPLHGILPFSRVPEFHADLLGLYARHAAAMAQHKVRSGAMFMSVATSAFLYEPVFYWQDERNACIERLVPADYLAQLPRYPPNPAGRALVAQMQAEIVALFRQHGAAHLQAGKAYPVLEGRNLPYLHLLRAAKAAADPDGRLNPGALGLQRGA